jgi:hypothetical protein
MGKESNPLGIVESKTGLSDDQVLELVSLGVTRVVDPSRVKHLRTAEDWREVAEAAKTGPKETWDDLTEAALGSK